MKSRKLQILIALGVSAVCLYFFAKDMDWPLVWAAIRQADYRWVFVSILLGCLSMLIRALRWQSFLGEPKITVSRLFLIMNVGFMGNNVFPARMGELIRPFLVWRCAPPHRFSTALATIIVERVFDLLGLLLILAYVFYVFPFPAASAQNAGFAVEAAEASASLVTPHQMQKYTQLAVLVFIALFGGIGILTYAPHWSRRTAQKIFSPLPHSLADKLLHMVVSFEKGASTFRRPASFFYCLLLTLVLWIEIALSELVILWAFYIPNVGFNGSLFLMAGLCFAVMFPQAPGYIGVYQGAVLAMLHYVFKVNKDIAGAAAWVMWGASVLPIIILGFICLIFLGVSFQEISRVQSQYPQAENSESNGSPAA